MERLKPVALMEEGEKKENRGGGGEAELRRVKQTSWKKEMV
jgi:hypothetical protein